jgi:serine/threonine protein kinase
VVQKVNQILRETCAPDLISVLRPATPYAGIAIGRYDVIDLLGRGSTGEVYAGRDRELGRPVALKIMSAEYATLQSSSQRFLREAQASSALNHPNIVTIHEVITLDSLPVIVMELVKGKPLRALCGKPMPVETAVPIAVQIMKALAIAHASGIVHRDLKPENVIVRPDGYVKVLDFGLASRSFVQAAAAGGEGSSTEGLPVGTLRYMSPEQCRGESATPASDVFAAGIVLYEMLVGRHPFCADSPLDTAHAIAWIEPRPLRQANPVVLDSIDQLVQAMLAKDANARPSSEQVVKGLATCLDRPVRKRVQNRAAVWLYAALVVALVAAGFFWLKKGTWGTKPPSVLQEPDLKIVALANLLGEESFPDLSPDGTRVAFGFSGESSPISHIYMKELGSSRLTQLTNDTLSDFEPVFSPDGSRMAFLRRQDGRLNLMIMPSTGGIEHKVGEISDSRINLRVMTWDAQGGNLIVSEPLGHPEVQMALFAISLDTGTKRQITFPKPGKIDCMPVMTPDGRSLGFARLGENGSGILLATPLASALKARGETQTRRLIPSAEPIFCWNWTADGHDLLVSRMLAGKAHLWRYPFSAGIGSSPPVRVAGLEEEVTQTSVSRVIDLLIYTAQTSRNAGIWSYRLRLADAGKRLIASAKMDVDARYSPDGKNIVFASARAGFGQIDLWMCASDGSNQRQLIMFEEPGEHAVGSPTWSPNGRWIAFDADLPGKTKGIYLLDVLGGKPKRLTSATGSEDSVPAWSSDGRSIYCSSYRGGQHNIWRVPLEGRPPVQITHDGGFESYESPDGKFLYYTRGGKPGICRMALPDGKGAAVAGLETVAGRCWEGSAKGIYFVSTTSKSTILQFFNFANQQVTRIRELPVVPTGTYRGLSVNPDGRTMLYLQRDPPRTNVMVVSNFH